MTAVAAKVRRSRARLWLVILCLGIPSVAWFGIRWRGAALREAAINRISIQNEPLTPALFHPLKRDAELDPSDWLARVARSRAAWDLSDLSDPAKYSFLLDEARANRLGEEARIAFEDFEPKFRSLLESAPDQSVCWNEFWVGLAVRLRECNGTSDWGEATRGAVRLLAVGLADCALLARQAEGCGPIDALAEASQLERTNVSFPKLPFLQLARLGDAVHVTAIYKAQSQFTVEALESLRAGLAVAHVHSESRWLLSEMMWALQMTRVLDGLQTILPMLPRGIDLAGLENQLNAARPRESMARAIRGERAFGNRVLELARNGEWPRGSAAYAPTTWFARLQRELVADFDQARYLEFMTESAERAAKSSYLRSDVVDGVPNSFWTPAAAVIAPQLEPSLLTSDLLDARLALARAALTAYRAGAKDALTFVSTSFDPFDGRPLRCGFGDDGLIVLWSVGPDGKDDAADAESDDIVWGLKLAE